MLFDHLQGRRILVFAGHVNKLRDEPPYTADTEQDSGTTALVCEGDTCYSWEGEVNLDLARCLVHNLEIHSREVGEETQCGCQVFLGHGSWRRRARLAKVYNPDAIISIHCNGFMDDTVRGHEVWYGGDDLSGELAKHIVEAVDANSLIPRHGHPDSKPVQGVHHIYDEQNPNRRLFEEIPQRPLVLVEAGFLSNPSDCELLVNMDVQAIIAFKIAIGIDAFFEPTLPDEEGGVGSGTSSDYEE